MNSLSDWWTERSNVSTLTETGIPISTSSITTKHEAHNGSRSEHLASEEQILQLLSVLSNHIAAVSNEAGISR